MNPVELQKKLIKAAQSQSADERVPYAFEKRVMALLKARLTANGVTFWVRGLWRAAISCVILTILLGAVSLLTPTSTDSQKDLSQDFENTLLASVNPGDNTMP